MAVLSISGSVNQIWTSRCLTHAGTNAFKIFLNLPSQLLSEMRVRSIDSNRADDLEDREHDFSLFCEL